MGLTISSLFQRMFGNKQVRILMVGLDAAGKTTILYKLKLGEIVTTIPTIGFNVETVDYKNISFTVWVCGHLACPVLWNAKCRCASVVVFGFQLTIFLLLLPGRRWSGQNSAALETLLPEHAGLNLCNRFERSRPY